MTIVVDVLAYDPEKVKPGWIAFFIVMILVVATFLLWRSMNTQLGKIQVPPRASFGPEGGERARASESDEDSPSAPPSSTGSPWAGDDDEEER